MQTAERRSALRPTGDPLSLYLYLRPLLQGARVLEGPWAESSATLRELGAAFTWAPEGLEGQESLARARFALGKASVDWILWNGDLEGLVAKWEILRELLAPEGRLLFSLGSDGSEGGPAARYREAVQELLRRFPSVQVLTRHGLRAEVVAPVGGRQEVRVDASLAGAPGAATWAFVCGQQPARLPPEQHLIPLPLEAAQEEAPVGRERRKPTVVDKVVEGDAPEGAAPQPEREAEAEEVGEEREIGRLRRKLGDARERAELAELRADEAEQRLRDAERRADRAEAERADLAVALRRLEHELEMAHRNNEALATTIAERNG